MADRMVTVDGVRYRREDAERLGLVDVKTETKAKQPANKARTTSKNKSAAKE